MNKKEIEDLIKFVSKSGVSEVSLEMKDIKITIKNAAPKVEQIITTAMPVAPVAPVMAPPVSPSQAAAAAAPEPKDAAKGADESRYVTIKSPMIGTFYRSPAPDKPNFVNVGDEIQPGKVLCIIEAMKLFNEIESEHKGKIVKVLVENASPVEYDQPLFLVDPS